MSDAALYARAIEANEQVTRAYRSRLAEMRAYKRTAHPGQPRRPYRHGRVGVR